MVSEVGDADGRRAIWFPRCCQPSGATRRSARPPGHHGRIVSH